MNEAILILGGSKSHIGFLQAAKRKGYKTIVVDMNPEAFCRDHSDFFINKSIFDSSEILNEIKNYDVKGVLTYSSLSKALKSAAVLANELKTPLYSEEVVDKITIKNTQKEILAKNGILMPKSIIIGPYFDEKSINQLSYPLIIKPAEDSVGSKGVMKINNISELNQYLRDKNGKFLLEEFIEGKLIQVAGIAYNNQIELLGILNKINRDDSFIVSRFEIEAFESDNFVSNYKQKIEQLFKDTNRAININNFFISTDMIIKNDGSIYVLETGLLLDTKVDRLFDFSGINVYEILIDVIVGKKPNIKNLPVGKYFLNFIFPDTLLHEKGILVEGNMGTKPESIADTVAWFIGRE